MNRWVFGIKNIYDKFLKIGQRPELLRFYINTYLLSNTRKDQPEIYIVSYPKSGRTWIRITLQKYLEFSGYKLSTKSDGNFVKLPGEKLLNFEHDQGNWVPTPVRTEKLYFRASKYWGKKVCLVVRNPCDVLVSSWYHLSCREKIYTKGLSDFIRDKNLGIEKVIAFMNMWIEHMHIPQNFSLLSYEEMRKDPVTSFQALFHFIELEIDNRVLRFAIEESSFEKMKQMELNNELVEPWMKPGSDSSENSMKVRKGKVNGYKDELSSEDIRFLQSTINTTLDQRFPYVQTGQVL